MKTAQQLNEETARLIAALTTNPDIQYLGTFYAPPFDTLAHDTPTCPTCHSPLTTLHLCPHCGVRYE